MYHIYWGSQTTHAGGGRAYLRPVYIDECSPDGKYIQLANTSAIKDVDLTGWRLLRSVNNAPEISFAMPSNFKLDNRKSIKIYACDEDSERLSCDLVSSNIST
ncbi:unnamed protein product [Adineta steineri]|uniref:LTD domain-containing protein n=1 Tax=Adineta steineri TaxID=433720 RepID=A0A819K1Q0_9BILA|nr:unnamed protein product [Adineta steineri]CAF3942133.1 unnamed protein product [Adineta steineri]